MLLACLESITVAVVAAVACTIAVAAVIAAAAAASAYFLIEIQVKPCPSLYDIWL